MEDETIVLLLLIICTTSTALFGWLGFFAIVSAVWSWTCIGIAAVTALLSLVFLYDFAVN